MENVIRLRPVAPRRTAEPEPLWRQALGRELREQRVVRGERIADVATRAGVSPQYLSELERGKKDPSSELLSAVAGALETSVLDLTRAASNHLGVQSSRLSGPVCLAA